jgi:hypothetical protein
LRGWLFFSERCAKVRVCGEMGGFWGRKPGDDSSSFVGYINRECNLFSILDKDRTESSPIFVLSKLHPAFKIILPFYLGGTLGGIKFIVQKTPNEVSGNSFPNIPYFVFRLENPTPPADAVIITSVTLSTLGIHAFTIRPSIGPEVNCKCESSNKN